MLKVRYWLSALFLLLFLPIPSFGQESVLRLRPYDGTAGSFLSVQLAADTAATHGIPANRVYVLQRGAPYLDNAVYRVNTGQTLRMRANDSAGVNRPVIFLYPTGTGANPQNPPGNLIDLRGNLELKDLVISGYFEPIDTNLNNLQGSLINVPTAGAGANILIDGCILTNSNGNHIRTDGAVNLVIVRNSIFANMGYLGRSNLGAGKGIDLRDASADTVIFENNTFVNWQDRVIRHYNFANPLAGTGPMNYMRFDHNTLVNGMSYHGLLSLGSMGPKAIITNNLLIDPFSLGNDSDATRQSEFVNNLERDSFGGARMAWIFTTPNDTTQWSIANNYYCVSPAGQIFFDYSDANPPLTVGSPLTYHINSKLGADSVNAFKRIDITLNNIPALMTELNNWYRSPTGGNKLKNTPNAAIWNLSFDFDRRGWQYYHDTLDCAYPTSSVAYTGAACGYPAGDLNWFPSLYAQWLTGVCLTDVAGTPEVPTAFTLHQNYPNPFNPATTISFDLEKSGPTTLTVYNVLGEKVATLVEDNLPAGSHKLSFDTSNLTTGVYYYRLESGGHVDVKNMMLLK